MAYLVHHTFNQNRTYTGVKLNPLPFDEKSLTNKLQHKKNTETNKSTIFPIQNQWKKVFVLFVLRLNVPVNNFSVMWGRSHRFLGN